MNGIVHALNVSTLAAWLSVAGLGGVAGWRPVERPVPAVEKPLRAEWREPEIHLGGEQGAPGEPAVAGETPQPTGEDLDPALPAPPAMPETAELPPLPEVPEMPVARDAPPAVEAVARSTAERPAARPVRRSVAGAGQAGGADHGGAAGGGGGGGGGMSQGARLAAGRMPLPVYPPEARRRNQEGTVMIAFTVDTNGRVISARVASSSPWPLLNDAAVRAVRQWRFPAGPVVNLQQPVVFQLR